MPEKGDPGFTLASLLILAAMGMFAWNSAPLQSVRPSNEREGWYEHRYDYQVPARLWQDPFNAIHRHKQALADRGVELGGGGSPRKHTLAEDVRVAVDGLESEKDELVVLVAMVNPGSYADVEEGRRRRRYAILSALGDSGFVPRSAETLGLFTPRTQGAADDSPPPSQDPSGEMNLAALDIPYEWYDYEDLTSEQGDGEDPPSGPPSGRSVLLLWLDESWLGDQPFARIHGLVSKVLPEAPHLPETSKRRHRIRWVMLGPSRSGTLRSMVRDRESPAVKMLRNSGVGSFFILSPVATVDDCQLDAELAACQGDARSSTEAQDLARPSGLLGPQFIEPCAGPGSSAPATCMRFLRTIRSDADLIEELSAELKRRRVEKADTVVALSEWDTYFGRSLPRALEKTLSPTPGAYPLSRYTYERGIDGLTQGEAASPRERSAEARPTDRSTDAEGTVIRRPLGTGQFDYLRRLAKVIRDKDERLRLQSGRGIKAVAVLGSDVYDKLLILRALRDQLPGAVWITTDLDANLLHPDEFAWARNLVVASTYDLRLPSAIQLSTPPFRDSYQTSAYLATRMAVDDRLPVNPRSGQLAMYAAIPPLLFEIGREQAVRLRTSSTEDPQRDGSVSIRPITRDQAPLLGPYLVGALLLAILGIVALHQLRPRSGRTVLALAALLLAVVALTVLALATADGGEPTEMREGVNMWPTTMIRLFTLGLTIGFVWSALRRLEHNWQDLNNRYFGGPPVPPDTGLTLREAGRRVWSRVHPQPWVIGCLVLLAVLVATMQALRQWTAGALPTLLVQTLIFAAIIAGWWSFLYGRMRVRSINRWVSQEHGGSATMLWRRYHQYGETRHRILRSAATTVLYFAFSSIVFGLLGGSSPPCRGVAACAVNGMVLGFSVLLMLFLLFLVVDAIRLSVCWIEKLQDPDLRWSDAPIQELARKRQLPEAHAAYWMQVHLIGERTREVVRLLYYPLIVILLMLLARSTYFDNWDFPLALAIVVGINFTIALAAAAKLNSAARQAREAILERLRNESLDLTKEQQPAIPVATPSEIDALIDKLSKLNLGAYQRVWEQPLVRATALLLTGLGLTYSEYVRILY